MSTQSTEYEFFPGNRVAFKPILRRGARFLNGTTGVVVLRDTFDGEKNVLCIQLDDPNIAGYETSESGHGLYAVSELLMHLHPTKEDLLNGYAIE